MSVRPSLDCCSPALSLHCTLAADTLQWRFLRAADDGAFDNGEPNGEGTRLYAATQIVHAGTWADGEPKGKGERRELLSGIVRRGHFVGERLSGEGEELLPGGREDRPMAERYAGAFVEGVRHGHGRVEHAATPSWSGEWSSAWEGEWAEGTPSGACTMLVERLEVGGEASYSGGWAHGARHGHGRQVDPDGSSYEGEYHRGFREGRGVETLAPSGEVYSGEFLAGRRHGDGELTRPDGWSFRGTFAAGVQRGEGVLSLGATDGDSYAHPRARQRAEGTAGEPRHTSLRRRCGEVRGAGFLDGELHGHGTRTYANGDVYTGELDRATPCGTGIVRYADGRTLEGTFVDGKAEGEAALTSASGDRYHGSVVASEPSGFGEWTSATDGSVYVGEFRHGLREGRGRLELPDGGASEGEWSHGELDGQAEVRRADGSYYRGHFLSGQRHGRGLSYDGSGSTYDGEWVRDQRWGEGTWVAPVGGPSPGGGAAGGSGGKPAADEGSDAIGDVPSRYTGQWVADLRVGRGSIDFTSGASYVGGLDSEQRYEGHGKHTAADGTTYEGEWQAGAYHGKGTLRSADGSEYEGEWIRSVRSGCGRSRLANGDEWSGGFLDGAMVGRGTLCYADGRVYEGEVRVTQRCFPCPQTPNPHPSPPYPQPQPCNPTHPDDPMPIVTRT